MSGLFCVPQSSAFNVAKGNRKTRVVNFTPRFFDGEFGVWEIYSKRQKASPLPPFEMGEAEGKILLCLGFRLLMPTPFASTAIVSGLQEPEHTNGLFSALGNEIKR